MNKEQFYNIISDSNLLTNVDEKSIDEIIKEFPYFQTAYILKTKILSDKGSFKYDNFIKLASLYSADRSKLYNYLHSDVELKTEEKLAYHQAEEISKVEETVKVEKVIPEPTDKIEIDKKVEPTKLETEKSETKVESKKAEKPIAEITKEDETKTEPKIIESVKEESIATEKQKVEAEETKPIDKKPIETKKSEVEKTDEKETIEKTEKVVKEVKVIKTDEKPKLEPKKSIEKPKIETLSSNATLAEKIIHKYKDVQKGDKKESIADIILRKAAEAKKQKAKQSDTKKTEPVLKKKPEEIKVEEKTFKPVKLEVKPEQKEPVKEAKKKAEPKIKVIEKKTDKVEKPIIKETKKVEKTQKKEIVKVKEDKLDVLSEINKISEKEIVTDYFKAEEVEETKPAKENMSFEDWLNFVDTPIKTSEKNKNQNSLIDKFISAEADIKIKSNNDSETDAEQLIKSGELERDDFITETLANIYIKQKLYEKAITAFTKLSLKYPEKNSYFADRIKKVEKLIKK